MPNHHQQSLLQTREGLALVDRKESSDGLKRLGTQELHHMLIPKVR